MADSTASSGLSLWDRITNFASRNRKTIIYTVAAITIVFTAGGVYYYTQQREAGPVTEGKKKQRKKRKQKETSADEESQSGGMTPHTPHLRAGIVTRGQKVNWG